MSVESIQNMIERVQREIEGLHRKATEEDRRHASKAERIAHIRQSTTTHTSPSILQSKLREIAALERDVVSIQKQRSEITKRISDKTAELHRHQQSLFREQQRDQKSLSDALRTRDRDWRLAQEARLRTQLEPTTNRRGLDGVADSGPQFDAFIAHAAEDKETVARPLAEKLAAMGFRIRYDEFQLKIGDSLRRSIDRGLATVPLWDRRALAFVLRQELAPV